MGKPSISALVVHLLVVLPLLVSAAAEEEENDYFGFAAALDSTTALESKIIAFFATFIVGVFGVCFAIFGLHVDGLFFFLVKPFGSCVISVACALYILPDAKKSLTSSCIGDFPMSIAVVAMSAAILTMIESKSFMNRRNQNGDQTHDGSVSVSVSHNKIRPNLVTQKSVLTYKKDKHEDAGGKEGEDQEKKGKKKDKKTKKEKNPEDKKDPEKLKMKLQKIEEKIQAMVVKKDEILKLIQEAEQAKGSAVADAPPPTN